MKPLSFVFLIVLGLLGPLPVKAQEHARLIPDSAILYVYTSSLTELAAAWQRTQLAQIGNFPALRSVGMELFSNLALPDGELSEIMVLEELWTAAGAAASYSIHRSADDRPSVFVLLDQEDGPDNLADYLNRLKSRLTSSGWRLDNPSQQVPPGASFDRFVSGKGKPLVLVIGRWNNQFCLSTDWTLATDVAQRALSKQYESSLETNDAYRQGMSSMDVPNANLDFFADPIELAQVYQADPDDGLDPRVIAAKHGFDAIQGVAGKAEIGGASYDILYRLNVHAPQPHTRSMPVFAFKNQASLEIPAWMPDYLHTMERIQIDLSNFLQHVAGPFDDLVADGTLQDILQDMKAADGPGVDLEAELFQQFDSTLWLLAESSFPPTRTSERSVLCIPLKNPQLVADAVFRLLKDDPNSQANRIPGETNVLWKFGLQESSGPNFSSSGVMVANDCLILASNIEAIRRLVLTANGAAPRLGIAPDLLSTFDQLDQLAGAEGFLRLFIRIDRDVRSAYELLRAGKVEDSESIYAQMVNRAIASARAAGKSLPDFATLPEFAQVEPYLGIGAAHGKTVVAGWEFSGFIRRK